MKTITNIIFLLISFSCIAQNNSQNFERKGFIFGTSIGASYLNLQFEGEQNQNTVAASFPNFKIGYMISKNTALLLHLPGSVYNYTLSGRQRDRGFEGIIPSVQYWNNHNMWFLAGVGISMDAPAFYDIKTEDERKFYFGYGIIASAGYEIWKKGRFAIDIQARMHYGELKFENLAEKGFATNILIGLNWN